MIRKLFLLLFSTLIICGCAPKAYISFMFDDGWSSVCTEAFPILSQYDYPATVFLVTDCSGKCEGYMTWEQINVLSDNGKWEIASHSHTHRDLTKLVLKDIEIELDKSIEVLKSRNYEITGFSTPYGRFNELVVKSVKDRFKYHLLRAWDCDALNSINNIDPYDLCAFEIKHDISVEEIKLIIDRAIAEKKWLILLLHNIAPEEDAKQYHISRSTFLKMVEYINNAHIKVVTIKKYLEMQEMHNLY